MLLLFFLVSFLDDAEEDGMDLLGGSRSSVRSFSCKSNVTNHYHSLLHLDRLGGNCMSVCSGYAR